ncbi:hypothetical protein JR065_00680 [Xanthomonas sp. AmX2]|uniref:hypothetical protein n=1 Tax=Xanthomonas sp. TaxID=29446 RepID=UPI001980E43A|nr:hypothetical protein [Xanthomonas sp.]MBN6148841.1 hypothetical protein [Xanthomonas sp.]
MRLMRYLAAAFNARPWGMPVPPNWFGLAAFAMLGWAVNPGFWLIGAGLEVAYLVWLANDARFQRLADARRPPEPDPAEQRYQSLLEPLAARARQRHARIESRAREIIASFDRSPVMAAHTDTVEQLVWLHLRMLSARQTIAQVVDTAQEEYDALQAQESQIAQRLARGDVSAELQRSLEQQQQVIDARQAAHADATLRLEHVDSELQRIDQQIALIREQTLLATDEERVGVSLDALSTSYNEASRWLLDQRDLLGTSDLFDNQPLPRRVLRQPAASQALKEGSSS